MLTRDSTDVNRSYSYIAPSFFGSASPIKWFFQHRFFDTLLENKYKEYRRRIVQKFRVHLMSS